MRVLHVLSYINNFGNGVVNACIDIACTQAQSGMTVAIASTGGEYEHLLTDKQIQHFYLNQSPKPQNLLKAVFSFRAIIRRFQPDVVHVHMAPAMLLTWALRWGATYKLVATVHSEFQKNAVLMGLADRVIVVSEAVGHSMIKRGLPKYKINVVLNGTLGSPRSQLHSDMPPVILQRPAITTVAGMYTRKGIQDLIAAFTQIAADFSQAHLYLVGGGDDVDLFKAQAAQSGVSDRIHFEGFQVAPQRYLQASDIFVLVSHKDPAPLVIPEAREVGCAIIGSHVDGIPELLDQGEAGILVPPQEHETLAQALTLLLQDPQLLNSWKQRSQMNLERFRLQRVVAEVQAVYDQLCPDHK